jgi:hypothetical protein
MSKPPAPYSHVTYRDDVLGALFRGRSFLGAIGATEALFGLVMMAFFSLVVIVTGALIGVLNAWLYGYPRLELPSLVLASLLWLPVAWLEWRSLVFFFDGLPGAAHPVPVHVATRLKLHRPLARVLIAAWWLFHAAAIVAVAEAFVYHLKPFNPDAVERVLYLIIPLAILFGTAFAMNTHLLVAVYALTRSERVVRWVYHFRVVLDLALVLGVPKVRLALTGGT